MYRQIAKNTTLMGFGTLFSRILGLVRDVLMAGFFGTSGALEAFLVAFKIPNLFRSFFAEGFADSVATPVLSSYGKDKEKMLETGRDLICLLSFFLLAFTAVGIIFARYFVILFAPGFVGQADKFNLAVSFTRITFFYLFLIGVASNFIAILYASKKFLVPAISPVFLNVAFILGILLFGEFFGVTALVYSVLAGGVLQLLFSFLALKKRGFKLGFNLFKSLKNNQVIKMFWLFGGRLASSIIYDISVIIDTIFSSLTFIVGQGALAAIYYANRLIQFPFAIIILSLSRVVMVDLSIYGKEKDMVKFKELLLFSFENVFLFIFPAVALFLFIPGPIVEVVFGRGQFGTQSLNLTSSALFFYAFGIFFFCGIRLLVNSFYSLADTKTPAKTAGIALLANIILSAIFIFPLKVGGVALGSSLAAGINFFLLYFLLEKKVGGIGLGKLKKYFYKVVFLSLTYGIFSRYFWLLEFNRYLKISLIGIFGLVIFGLGGYFLNLRQIKLLWQWILKRR